MNNKDVLKEARRCFFVAMLSGWAGDAKGILVPNKPGFKQTEYLDGDFRVLDEYGKGRASNKSTGTTTIWFLNEPIWVMTYGGFYRKSDIPFLKSALLDSYQRGEFLGGRGRPWVPSGSGLLYSNIPNPGSTFSDFGGNESIVDHASGNLLGHHQYQGMSLLSE